MRTAEQTAAIAQVTDAFRGNIAALDAALRDAVMGPDQYIFVWPEYWLAVDYKGQACRVDRAAVVKRNDNRTFTNGKGERAVLMLRKQALINALHNARDILKDFETKLSA